MAYILARTDELCHHGIKGQRWGVRRYQNEDGTLTSTGRKRLMSMSKKREKAVAKRDTEYKKQVPKIVKLEKEISDKRAKADRWLTSKKKSEKLNTSADELDRKLKTLEYRVSSKENSVKAIDAEIAKFLKRLPEESVFKGKSYTQDTIGKIASVSLNDLYKTDGEFNNSYYELINKYLE